MQVIKVSVSVISLGLHSAKTSSNNVVYYSFTIFSHLWLDKTTHIIHHNQLLLTKFGRNFVIEPMTSKWCQKCSLLQVIEPLTDKPWGQDWVALVVRTKWQNCRGTFYSFHGEYCLKTSQEQQEDILTDNIWYLEYICRPSKPLISLTAR